MGPTSELIKADILEQLDSVAARRLPSDRVAEICRFMRILYGSVPAADLAQRRPDHLYAAAVSLHKFVEERATAEPKVRVFDPQPDQDGWRSSHTIVEVVTDDMPFLVDSVTIALAREGAEVRLLLHPIVEVERRGDGTLERLIEAPPAPSGPTESVMHIRIRAEAESRHAELRAAVLSALSDVRAAVEDLDTVRDRCREVMTALRACPPDALEGDPAEALELLDWLNEGHFIYLGYRHRGAAPDAPREPGLGVLRDPGRHVFDHPYDPRSREPLRIVKGNRRSTVHRPAHVDVVMVPDVAADGSILGEHRFAGLFTLAAYSRSPSAIPLLRGKVARVLASSGFSPQSHDGKTLRSILETYPRDELFQIGEADLLRIATGILHLVGRPRPALFVRLDPYGRFVSCLVYLPRDRLDTELRLRIQDILARAYGGRIAAYYTHVGDEALARIHFIVTTPGGADLDVDVEAVEHQIVEATRSWEDRLENALAAALGEELGNERFRQYAGAFGPSYREAYDEHTAASDIEFIEAARAENGLALHVWHPVELEAHQLRLKIYAPEKPIAPSDALPILENLGLRVIGEVPHEIRLAATGEPQSEANEEVARLVWIHDFQLEAAGVAQGRAGSPASDGSGIDLRAAKDAFVEVFQHVWRGEMENDALNKLVLRAGLGRREVVLLRSYTKLLRQAQVPFSQQYMEQTLEHYAPLAHLLVRLFDARLRPSPDGDPGRAAIAAAAPERASELHEEIESALDRVESLDEDRILRAYLDAILATRRTNFYQRGADGKPKPYVSLKLDSRELRLLPEPRPEREIFVFSPRVEGVHLRFGKIARGGLRWSDRLEDFRTEVLGLVKAQQVKNAVIVPVGSKGGFVVKRPPALELGREARQAEGIECYRTFIRGLLDLTDNLCGETVTSPPDVVCLDDEDPYLVVAADKGTATFSDIANAVAAEYDFWLDDAFASGGSAGYDHKEMGITARGAWESVKRHFRELGKDVQTQDFTCVGVGDMSGDVFGNGLLLSRHTRLLAAFNHLHVFVDPDPDAEASWVERKRLFDLPRSTWADYDESLISRGGGVFERSAKSIRLSDEMRELFDLEPRAVTPAELVRAILRANVELLFFGGIGTYVKATSESHADVGDRANNGVRIDAKELRACVIGEGANLGMTQRGRTEFGLLGGRCNTDFIDNSAGVDCSDHEVNIKILLGAVERAGDLTRKQRNELLEEMTEDVASLVLRDSYLQTETLAVSSHLGAHLTDRTLRLLRALEQAGRIDRAIEFLPDDETILERQKRDQGFTRAELCVLLSYCKNSLFADLVGSSSLDDPSLETELFCYFPPALQRRFPDAIRSHRLRRQIVATTLANEITNRVGIHFALETHEVTGSSVPQIALAYVTSRDVFGVHEMWRQIEALDGLVATDVQAAMLVECSRIIGPATAWLLRDHAPIRSVDALRSRYRPAAQSLIQQLDSVVAGPDRVRISERQGLWEKQGVPSELARHVSSLPLLFSALDLARIAHRTGRELAPVSRIYFEIGEALGFGWLRATATTLPATRAWDKLAVSGTIDELYSAQAQITLAAIDAVDPNADDEATIAAFVAKRRPEVEQIQELLAELRTLPAHDLAQLTVLSHHLNALVTRHDPVTSALRNAPAPTDERS